MADRSNTSEEGPAPAPPAPKKKSKLVLIITLVIALAGAGGGYFFFFRNPAKVKAAGPKGKNKEVAPAPDDDASDDEDDDKGKDKDKGKKEKGKAHKPAITLPEDEEVKQVVEIPAFILNLADQEENRFLRLTMSLGIAEEGGEKPDLVFLTRVRNAVLSVLMTKTSTELLSADGKTALRRELLAAVQAAAKEPVVHAVYITELIVQR
jgi:flagellar FliL protein